MRPEIRRIIIERHRMPQYLIKGTVKPAECLALFDEYVFCRLGLNNMC